MFFVNLLCPGVRAKGGSRLGGHTRGPPPMAPALAGTHADGVRIRAFCVSRHWTFPFAGGELAHRGTCPTLVLYLFKEINPPKSKYTHTLRGLGGAGGSNNYHENMKYFAKTSSRECYRFRRMITHTGPTCQEGRKAPEGSSRG